MKYLKFFNINRFGLFDILSNVSSYQSVKCTNVVLFVFNINKSDPTFQLDLTALVFPFFRLF